MCHVEELLEGGGKAAREVLISFSQKIPVLLQAFGLLRVRMLEAGGQAHQLAAVMNIGEKSWMEVGRKTAAL